MRNEFESTLLENCVTEIARLPGIGRKTALRLALHLLRQDQGVSMALGLSLIHIFPMPRPNPNLSRIRNPFGNLNPFPSRNQLLQQKKLRKPLSPR